MKVAKVEGDLEAANASRLRAEQVRMGLEIIIIIIIITITITIIFTIITITIITQVRMELEINLQQLREEADREVEQCRKEHHASHNLTPHHTHIECQL